MKLGLSIFVLSSRQSPTLLHRLLEVLDKGKAASVTTIVYTKDIATGNVIFENQITVFIRGAGGFGGKRSGRGNKVSINRTLAYLSLLQIEALQQLSIHPQSVNLML
jgi:hypothetical protein